MSSEDGSRSSAAPIFIAGPACSIRCSPGKVGVWVYLVTRGFEDITVMEGRVDLPGPKSGRGTPSTAASPHRSARRSRGRRSASPSASAGGCYQGNIHLPAGHALIPLNEDSRARRSARTLIERGVEVIGILFVYSFVNPEHEHRAKAIVEEVLDRERPVASRGLFLGRSAGREREQPTEESALFQCFAAEQVRDSLLAGGNRGEEPGATPGGC